MTDIEQVREALELAITVGTAYPVDSRARMDTHTEKVLRAALAILQGKVLVDEEKVHFVEDTVCSALKGLLPDVKDEEQRDLMEAAIEATGNMLAYLHHRKEENDND